MKSHDDIPGIVFIRAMGNATQRIRSIQHRLDCLAQAFETTGNEKMADEMSNLSLSLETVSRDLQASHDTCIKDEYRETVAGVGATLSAILNMSEERAAKLNDLVGP